MLTGDAEAAESCMARHLGHVRSLWAQGAGGTAGTAAAAAGRPPGLTGPARVSRRPGSARRVSLGPGR